MGPEKGIFECNNTGYQNTLNQLLDFWGGGGEREIKGIKTPGLVVPKRVDLAVFLLGGKGALNIITFISHLFINILFILIDKFIYFIYKNVVLFSLDGPRALTSLI